MLKIHCKSGNVKQNNMLRGNMHQIELTEDQRRRFIDAKQIFEAWREANREFRHSYRGFMRWRRVKNKAGAKDYLYRISGRAEHSLGLRSLQTERIKHD